MSDKKFLIIGAAIFCSVSLNLSLLGDPIGAWLAMNVILMIDAVWRKNQTIEMLEKTDTFKDSQIMFLEGLLKIK